MAKQGGPAAEPCLQHLGQPQDLTRIRATTFACNRATQVAGFVLAGDTKMRRRQIRALFRNSRSRPAALRGNRWSAPILASVVTFLVTVLGFGISAFGFWSSLRQTDDLRVLITSSTPLITIDNDSINIMQALDLTYINSGNRQARISNLGLIGLKYNDTQFPTDRNCDEGEPDTKIYPTFDFSSATIKPGEILDLHDLKYRHGAMSRPLGKGISFPNLFRLTASDSMLVCLQQRVITPDSYVSSLSKALWLIRKNGGDLKPLFDQERPITVKKTTRYFD
jgi:hypothetical protein